MVPEATLHGLERLYAFDPLGFLLGSNETGEALPELLSARSMSHSSEALIKIQIETKSQKVGSVPKKGRKERKR